MLRAWKVFKYFRRGMAFDSHLENTCLQGGGGRGAGRGGWGDRRWGEHLEPAGPGMSDDEMTGPLATPTSPGTSTCSQKRTEESSDQGRLCPSRGSSLLLFEV